MLFFSRLNKDQHRLGMILAFGSLLGLGTYNALAKGLTPYLSPVALLLVSELLTAIFITMTFGLVSLAREFSKLSWRMIGIAMAIGLINSAVAPFLWFKGLQDTTAMNASIFSTADIVGVIVFGYFVLGERINRMQGIGAAVVIAGILVVNLGGSDLHFALHKGDILILTATQLFVLGAVLFKKYLSHVMAELVLVIRNLTGVAAVLLVSVLSGHHFVAEIASFPFHKVLLLLAFVFFSRYLALTFYYESLERIPVTVLSLIQIAGPIVGVLAAALILGETIEQYHVLGGMFIGVGLLVEQTTAEFWHSIHLSALYSSLKLHLRPRVEASHLVMRVSKQA